MKSNSSNSNLQAKMATRKQGRGDETVQRRGCSQNSPLLRGADDEVDVGAALNANWNNGFTLIEVIVAVTILAIGMVTIAELISGGLRAAYLSRDYTRAVTYASSKLGEIALTDKLVEGSESQTFPDDDRFRWEQEIVPYKEEEKEESASELFSVTVRVFMKEPNGKEKKVELSTLRVQLKEDGSSL